MKKIMVSLLVALSAVSGLSAEKPLFNAPVPDGIVDSHPVSAAPLIKREKEYEQNAKKEEENAAQKLCKIFGKRIKNDIMKDNKVYNKHHAKNKLSVNYTCSDDAVLNVTGKRFIPEPSHVEDQRPEDVSIQVDFMNQDPELLVICADKPRSCKLHEKGTFFTLFSSDTHKLTIAKESNDTKLKAATKKRK